MDWQRRETRVAALATLAIHAALALLLPRLASRPAPAPGRPLEVVFLVPPPPARHRAAPVSAQHPSVANPAPKQLVPVTPSAATAPATTADPEPAATRPLSAVYLQQARQWAAQQAPDAARDPLADRTPPVEPDGRFRMQRPKSVAGTVAAIGRLFGGANYTTDDCGRMSESITGLMAAGDERAAREAIDYEKRYCRP